MPKAIVIGHEPQNKNGLFEWDRPDLRVKPIFDKIMPKTTKKPTAQVIFTNDLRGQVEEFVWKAQKAFNSTPEDTDILSITDATDGIMILLSQAISEAVKEIIICAAIKTSGNVVVRGHRHNDCIKKAFDMSLTSDSIAHRTEGFITSKNRFVDRKEAHQLHFGTKGELFSEDLY